MAFLDENDIQGWKEDFDQMLNEFGKDCRLVYPPTMEDCNRCSTSVGGRPENIWRHGGPTVISGNLSCGVCGGTGKRSIEQTENIKMIVDFASALKSNWRNKFPSNNISLPFSVIQTKGFARDLPKILNCIEMHLQLPLINLVNGKYRLLDSPTDFFNIVPGNYFMAVWERIS